MEQKTYTARWIFPIDSPPLERGAITLRADKIAAVAPHGTRTPDVDLGNVAVLPGFVNAHTHLDLTGARACRPPVANAPGSADFIEWLRSVIAFRRTRTPGEVYSDIAAGFAECLRFGTTLIGDISSGGASWRFLSQAKGRAVVFHELLGLSDERAEQSRQGAEDWLTQHSSTALCVAGVSPHAPYSARFDLFSVFGKRPQPIATHLAETPAELELVYWLRGPLVDFLKELNAWEPDGFVFKLDEVVRKLRNGIFVHCNYLNPATRFKRTQSVVVCPRTHHAFGHARHPFPEFLKRGVRVALGTDSLASNPDLDILAEARHLRRHYPEVEPATLLRMLTLSGAEALGFDAVAGSLTPGKSADLVVLPLPNDERGDPHDLILQSTLPIERVMFRGEWVELISR